MFEDRIDAGDRLAALLVDAGVEADLVLAIPRGGLPVGRAVADRLGVPLDVVVAVKLGAPGNPELAVGAVAGDGSVWLNDDLVSRLGVDDAYLDQERARGAATAVEKIRRYRGGESLSDLTGERVVVVDDGLATGATAVACVRQVRAAGADRVVLAVPVAAPDSVARLEREADEVVAVETPASFGAVGQYYRNFRQIRDTEAQSYLWDDDEGPDDEGPDDGRPGDGEPDDGRADSERSDGARDGGDTSGSTD